jgi:hypothetical protein
VPIEQISISAQTGFTKIDSVCPFYEAVSPLIYGQFFIVV